MAPKYKLTYFNGRGRAEAIRFLFHYGDIDFEDVRVEVADGTEDLEEFRKAVKNFPNGKLPVLEAEGKVIGQSVAICRFVAKMVGLAGGNDFEALLIDSAADTVVDTMIPLSEYRWLTPEAEKQKKKESLLKEHVPNYFGSLEKQVKENGGYLVNGKLSYADVLLASLSETLCWYVETDLFTDYPSLTDLVDKVYAIPKIKAWVDKRPKTDF